MNKEKRIVQRPYGRRKNGGWIIQTESLLKALKEGDVVEFGTLRVGAHRLRELIRLMTFPDYEVLVTANGRLECQNMERVFKRLPNGLRRCGFRKPRLAHSFRVADKVWLPAQPKRIIVIKPKKYE